MKPETITTNPARLLPEVTATRTARIEAAHARHAITNHGGTWTAVPGYTDNKSQTHAATVRPPIYRQTPEQLTATAENVTRIVLRAREQASGLDLFRQLANEAHRDSLAANRATIEAEADTLRAQAAQLRKAAAKEDNRAKTAARRANKATTNEEAEHHRNEERKAAREAARLTREANAISKAAAALAPDMALISSDRADIVQAALAAALTHDHAADPDGAFAAMCAAAGRGIGAIASPSALTAHRTKVHELTPEEAAELNRRYGEGVKIPHPVRGCTSQCFDTVELRTRGKGEERRPVWCKVSHYTTVAPYISYEAYTEATGGDTAELATNGGINAIGTAQDAADIADLLTRANLTAKYREIVALAADQTAARHGQAAASEYLTKRTAEIAALKTAKARREAWTAAQATADRERIAAQWESAFDRYPVYSQRTRRHIKAEIHSALTAAQRQPDPLTEREQEEREAKRWTAMQRNSRRGRPAADRLQKPLDPYAILTATHTKTESGQTVTTWSTAHAIPADTVTAWQTPGKAWRAAEEARAKGGATSRTRTAFAAHNAAAVALFFLAEVTAREAEEIAATLRAEAEHSPDHLTAAVLEHDRQRATAPRGHAPAMTAREAREAARRAARLAEMEAFTAIIEAEDKRRAATQSRPTYTAAEVEAMRARAKATAARHNAIMEAARAAEPSRTR